QFPDRVQRSDACVLVSRIRKHAAGIDMFNLRDKFQGNAGKGPREQSGVVDVPGQGDGAVYQIVVVLILWIGVVWRGHILANVEANRFHILPLSYLTCASSPIITGTECDNILQ